MEENNDYYDFDNIMERMLSRIDNSLDKREGSIIYDALAPTAAELAQMYITLKNNIDLIFVDTAVDDFLDRLAEQVGLKRKGATKAIRVGMFYNEQGELMDINIGERFTIGNEGLTYIIIEKMEKGKYKLECETPGIVGNVLTGKLIPIDYIQELGRAELIDMLIPGEDAETDEQLRDRYYESINEKAFGGNIADYKNKTKDIQGVGAVKVTPVWNGGGTVKLTILDSSYDKATELLINSVQDAICPDSLDKGLGLAPVGHKVTVETVSEVEINLSANVYISRNASQEEVKEEIKNQTKSYLLGLRKIWEDEKNLIVRIAQIESKILNINGVLDVSNVTINSQATNVELEEMEIPILKEVTLL